MPIGDCYCPGGYLVQRLPYMHTGESKCFMCDIKVLRDGPGKPKTLGEEPK